MPRLYPVSPPPGYMHMYRGRYLIAAASGAGKYLFGELGGGALAGSASSYGAIYLDPADHAVTGKTTKLRVAGRVHTNAVASGITFTFGLWPVATVGGASGSNPTVATVGTATVDIAMATPSASAQTAVASADVNFPAAGWFALGCETSGSTAANSISMLMVELAEVRLMPRIYPASLSAHGSYVPIGVEGYYVTASGAGQLTDGIAYGESVAAFSSGGVFDLDPAWLADIPGKTKKIRVGFNVQTNAVAPARDVTWALKPVTSRGGGSGSAPNVGLGAAVCSVTIASATLTATGSFRSYSADVDFPVADYYALAITTSGALAAGASIAMRVRLQTRYA